MVCPDGIKRHLFYWYLIQCIENSLRVNFWRSILLCSIEYKPQGFLLTMFKSLIESWPVGSYLVMNSTPRVTVDRPLMYIGYNYTSRKFLRFIFNELDESTELGDPYLSHFTDNYSNVYFFLLFVLVCLACITVSVIQWIIKTGCGSLTQGWEKFSDI